MRDLGDTDTATTYRTVAPNPCDGRDIYWHRLENNFFARWIRAPWTRNAQKHP